MALGKRALVATLAIDTRTEVAASEKRSDSTLPEVVS